jgi:hypothetical protein
VRSQLAVLLGDDKSKSQSDGPRGGEWTCCEDEVVAGLGQLHISVVSSGADFDGPLGHRIEGFHCIRKFSIA